MCYSGKCKFENWMGDCSSIPRNKMICCPTDIQYEKIMMEYHIYQLQVQRKYKLDKIQRKYEI